MAHNAIWPQAFSAPVASAGAADDTRDPPLNKLIEYFQAKGLPALKHEDGREKWYQDWIDYQSRHRLYASLLAPKRFSSSGSEIDLLKLVRFLEAFGYFSPAHGYSLQVTFLGLFAILMGSNDALKRQAVAALEAGQLFGLGVSEKEHGADLLGGEFTVWRDARGRFIANGSKYYIGNANCAAMIAVLARQHEPGTDARARARRPRFVLFALRPSRPNTLRHLRKIGTLGVRAAFVGAFDVEGYEFPQDDVIAEGRDAWDAVLGTVTLGKFFLGFGSIGICEHAFAEAIDHLTSRVLYGKPAIDIPHIRLAMAQAYARLTAMKLYAYRALDYLHAAGESDRRYLLFNAVQKARVSTQGVRVVSLISACVGARGFESDTYIEMALRDIRLIPSLEGSAHLNLALAAQFIPQYLEGRDDAAPQRDSLVAGDVASRENPYLMQASTGNLNRIGFPPFDRAYQPLLPIDNVRRFARQSRGFHRFATRYDPTSARAEDASVAIAAGRCLATICYGQLVAENVARLDIPPQMTSVIFGLLVSDLSDAALKLASLPSIGPAARKSIRRLVAVPRTAVADWDWVFARMATVTEDRTAC